MGVAIHLEINSMSVNEWTCLNANISSVLKCLKTGKLPKLRFCNLWHI